MALIKGHNSGTNLQKMTCNNSRLDLVNINANIKFGKILSICSQDIERKQNFGINQGPSLVNMNAYMKFGEILLIFSQGN